MTCIIHTPVGDVATTQSIHEVHTALNQATREKARALIETAQGPLSVDPSTAVACYGSLRPNIRVSDLSEPIRRLDTQLDLAAIGDDDLLTTLAARIDNDGDHPLLERLRTFVSTTDLGNVDDDALVAEVADRVANYESPAFADDVAQALHDTPTPAQTQPATSDLWQPAPPEPVPAFAREWPATAADELASAGRPEVELAVQVDDRPAEESVVAAPGEPSPAGADAAAAATPDDAPAAEAQPDQPPVTTPDGRDVPGAPPDEHALPAADPAQA